MTPLHIIKVGGAVLSDRAESGAFLDEFASVPGAKILVHGGGRSATALAERLGIETRIEGGRRITDAAMLEVVTMVYGGLINRNVVAALQGKGVNAVGLTGADLGTILSVRRPVGKIDYGYAGDIVKVNTSILEALVLQGVVPVFAPLTHDGNGGLLNTNADTIVAALATAFSSRFEVTLEYRFEKEGVIGGDGNLIPRIDKETFGSMVADGVISGGMIPKIENALGCVMSGVKEVCIGKTRISL